MASCVIGKEELDGKAISFTGDSGRVPRDGLLGADLPDFAPNGICDNRCDERVPARRDGVRGRRGSSEGEGRKECSE
jgi:hypothetical protein